MFMVLFCAARWRISSMSISFRRVLTSMRWINSMMTFCKRSLSASTFSFSLMTAAFPVVSSSDSPLRRFFCDFSCDRRSYCLIMSSLLATRRACISLASSSVSSKVYSAVIFKSSISLHLTSSSRSCSNMVSAWSL